MLSTFNILAALETQQIVIAGLIVAALFALLVAGLAINYGALWLQAYMSGADVSFTSLISMSLLRIKPRMIVTAKIMATQAGLNIHRREGMSTARLEAHFLAGGNVMQVIRAIIAADRAGIDLDFDRAAAIDLAGRDVLDAVRTSVSPHVIDCPDPTLGQKSTLSAVAKNGVELRIHVRVTVRTNLDQLIGGATEETIIARVGQGIVTAIGSAESHMDVLETPNSISKSVLTGGLDANTAFEIVSIDIAYIDVGENIGARLQTDQADADARMARALAAVRSAEAIALRQQMKAQVTKNRALLVLAEAEVPAALADAFRSGALYSAGALAYDPKPAARLPDVNDALVQIDVLPTPVYVLMDGKQRLGPIVSALSSGKKLEAIYGFSDKVPYDRFCGESQLGLTPYPLVKGYLQSRIDTLNADDDSLKLVVLDAAGPRDPSLYAATMAAVLEAQKSPTTHLTATHILTFDPTASVYRLNESPGNA